MFKKTLAVSLVTAMTLSAFPVMMVSAAAPVLSGMTTVRPSATNANFIFSSSVAGTIVYVVDTDGDFTDTDFDTTAKIDAATPATKVIASGINSVPISNLISAKATKIYYYTKDAGGIKSAVGTALFDPVMNSTVLRDHNNKVTLNWDAVPGAVGYNIYDATFKSQNPSTLTTGLVPYKNSYNTPVKLTTTPVTSTSYEATDLDAGTNGLVHRLTIKAVDGNGTEFSTATEQIGLLQYQNIPYGTRLPSLQGKTLKMPVSDFTNNLEFVNLNIRDDKWQYWCYSALEDPNNPGKIHLFLTRIPAGGDFTSTWKTKSEIVHMVGDSYEGPFTELGVVRTNGKMADPAFTSAHNSRIKYIDGKYVLLYIEIDSSATQRIVMETVDPASLPGGHLPTTINDETYWTPVTGVNNVADGVVIKSDLDRKKVNNPDILKTPSGTYNIMYKSDTHSTSGTDLIYKATSNNLTGPYTPTIDSLLGNPTAIANQKYLTPSFKIEDHQLFEWKHKYFMLNYDLYSQYTSNEANTYPGVLWVSRDGEKFDASDSYIAEGVLSDYVKKPSGSLNGYGGDSGGTTRMERPYFIFDKDGNPIYFTGTNAWNFDGDENGGTSNIPGLAVDNLFKIKPLPMHDIKVSSSANTNGSVTITKVEGNTTRASNAQGEQYDDVYFTVSPKTDYGLKNGTLTAMATDSVGTPINVKLESLGSGQYRFIMPPGDVTIGATFSLAPNITGVKVTQSSSALQGSTTQFAAEVTGTGDLSQLVTWSVSGNNSASTTINTSGLLTISPYETASQLTVKATSADDATKNGTKTIDIVKNVAVMDSTMTNAVVTASSYFNNGSTNYLFPRNLNDGATAYLNPLPSTSQPAGSGYANTNPTGTGAYYKSTNQVNQAWQPVYSAGTNPWLQFTFNTEQTFNTIVSYEGAAHNGSYLQSYDLETSTDGSNWTKVQSINYATPSSLKKSVTLNAPITSQYVRLTNMTSSLGGTNLWYLTEIQMFNIPVVTKTALTAKIAEAQALNSNNYTASSWTSLQMALTAAINVNNDANATQAQVDTATADLQTAISGLQSGGAQLTGTASIQTGQPLNLTYSLVNVTSNVYAQDITVSFDPTQLQYVSSESLVNGFSVVGESGASTGNLRLLVAGTGPNSSVTGTMDVLKLNFQTKQLSQSVTSQVYLNHVVVANEHGIETPLNSLSTYNVQITVPILDKTELYAKIAAAQAQVDAAKISSTKWGHYSQSAVDACKAVISSANTVANDLNATQAQADQAVTNLDAAMTVFAAAVNTTASIGDLALLASHYGASSSSTDWASIQMYDLNHDNKLDIIDLAAMARKILGL